MIEYVGHTVIAAHPHTFKAYVSHNSRDTHTY